MIFEHSAMGVADYVLNALSAPSRAANICSFVCSVNTLSTSPVAGLTLRYGTLGSFACGYGCRSRYRNGDASG